VAQPLEILLVEDNPADALLTLEALRDTRTVHNAHLVGDGGEALRLQANTAWESMVAARGSSAILESLRTPGHSKDSGEVRAD
jgi:CheY-like chemotaxis protein